jgi:hypothetical protein
LDPAGDAETAFRIADTIHALRVELAIAKEDIVHQMMKKDIIVQKRQVAVQPKRTFIRACPANTCRGFLSTAWKCGLCDVWVCPDCHEIKGTEKDADHICDMDTLETVKLLTLDTRQCPKCPTMIFKISGCDQMYCTQCHTAFSWRTGQVETGVIHNPHHYEYLRQQAPNGVIRRNPGDVRCGEQILTAHELQAVLTRLRTRTRDTAWNSTEKDLMAILRVHGHIQYDELRKNVVNNREDNEDLRIKYMVNEIDAERFKVLLQQREKKNEKKNEIHMVLTTYLEVVKDHMNSTRTFTTKTQAQQLLESLERIRTYTNTSMVPISKRYNCVVPNIELNDVKSVKY